MRLSDCFMEIIAYVDCLLEDGGQQNGSFERVQADMDRLFSKSRECATSGGFTGEDFDLAMFAVCAWVDERILSSGWPHKALWQREQLQRKYFNTTNAGEEFFEKMNSLGPHQRDVREIYFMCLCLGFAGRYCHEGDEYLLEQVKMSNLKLLTGASVAVPSLQNETLFPSAYPAVQVSAAAHKPKRLFSTGHLLALIAPVTLFGALFAIYSFILKGVGDSIVDLMR